MPAPKSNWIAKSQQMMYPIEMQAIGMSNQANAQIAQSIERTGQRVQEIQLKKQAFAEHHQRTMMMQAAEQQKMALQNIAMDQSAKKMLLLEQKHALDQKTGKQKNYQSQLGMATLTPAGNMRINLAGEGGKMTHKEFPLDPKTGMPSPEDQKEIEFLRQSQMRPQRQSPMDEMSQNIKKMRMETGDQALHDRKIAASERELDRAEKDGVEAWKTFKVDTFLEDAYDAELLKKIIGLSDDEAIAAWITDENFLNSGGGALRMDDPTVEGIKEIQQKYAEYMQKMARVKDADRRYRALLPDGGGR